ncbi:hypothetical protein L1049_011208 [Liquidambar formosana]|uniref:Uncharacterized protein n=1 Tax=Liquidambar formosana TaxID=63359 RepID=A0AAP0RR81_LIQFO
MSTPQGNTEPNNVSDNFCNCNGIKDCWKALIKRTRQEKYRWKLAHSKTIETDLKR